MQTTTLQATLDDFGGRIIRDGVLRALLWAIAMATLALVIAAWLDLVVDFAGGVRVGLVCLAGGVLVVTAIRTFRIATRFAQPRVIAERLDAASDQRRQIVAGVDLLLYPHSTATGLSSGLASIAIDRAARLASNVPANAVVQTSRRKRPLYLLASVIALVVVVGIAAPRLLKTQLARFIDPFGDHPPYTNLEFAVTPGDTSVIFGASTDVNANIEGGRAENVELVLETTTGEIEAVPMFPVAEKQWRASLVHVTDPVKYYVRSGRGGSIKYDLGVITVPQIEKVQFTITPPEYTHRPAYNGPLPKDGLSGLRGTRVRVAASSNRDLQGGSIVYTKSDGTRETLSMAAGSTSSEAFGEFEIASDGKIEIGVVDQAGQASTALFSARVSMFRDQRPFVRLQSPQAVSYATPGATIDVVGAAEDDFGVARVQLFRGLNDSRPRPMDFDVDSPQPTRYEAKQRLKISEYGLKAGDVVKLFARVEDTDPAGAKGSESPVAQLFIVSQEEMDQMLLTRQGIEALEAKYAATARQMEQLASKIKELSEALGKVDPDDPLTAEQMAALDRLAAEAQRAAGETAEASKQPLPLELDKLLNEHVQAASAAMKQASGALQSAAGLEKSAGQAKEELDNALAALGQHREELAKEAQAPVEDFGDVYRLLADEGRFLQLASAQQDLASRMSALETKNGDDDPQLKSRIRELQDEQDAIRRDVEKLSREIREHASRIESKDDFKDLYDTAIAFADALEQSDASPQMRKSSEALQDFAGTRASVAARAASDELQKLIGQCSGMGDQSEAALKNCTLKFGPSISSAMEQTAAELMAAAGMGTKPGTGRGNGEGYSAKRSSLQNVGLYGATPKPGTPESAMGGGNSEQPNARNNDRERNPDDNPDGSNRSDGSAAAGASDAPVPAEYQGRVSDYFRRVADELEK